MHRCASFKSQIEKNIQCHFMTTGIYCALHEKYPECDYYCPKNIPTTREFRAKENTPIIRIVDNHVKIDKSQKNKLVKNLENIEENEDLMEIKTAIISAYIDEYILEDLIGPVFRDVTLSYNSDDPITFDTFWEIHNGIKVSLGISPYLLFSYYDQSNRLICLTIFTVYEILNSNTSINPSTDEEIPEEYIFKAYKLVELYIRKVNLFNPDKELNIRNRIINIFSTFHKYNIYYDEAWITNLTRTSDVKLIIKNTYQLLINNLEINDISTGEYLDSDVQRAINYLVSEWERLVDRATPHNFQTIIWIIGKSISYVNRTVLEKYPCLVN